MLDWVMTSNVRVAAALWGALGLNVGVFGRLRLAVLLFCGLCCGVVVQKDSYYTLPVGQQGAALCMNCVVSHAAGESGDYAVVPSSFWALAHLKCKSAQYDKAKDGDLPTCHSQLYPMQGKSGVYPYAPTEYEGVEQSENYMPTPAVWESWDKGFDDCNQDANGVCKKKVECSMYEEFYSLTDPYAYRGLLVRINQDWKDSPYRYVPLETPRCTMCVPTPCADASCPFGKIQGSPLVAYNNLVYQRPSCRETCAAGTFLTCNTGLDCRYQAPSTYHVSGDVGARAWLYLNQYTVKSDLNLGGGWPLPASGCYPCKFANGRTHFGTYFGTDATLYQDNFLQFECPGGAQGPRACGRNKVAKFDNATGIAGGCYCRDGWYKANAGDEECTRCPAGYWCKWDKNTPPTKKECDVDMYSFEGQTECRNCTVNTNICPKSQALTRCVRGNNGEYQSRDAFCTDCGNCRQITNADGALPCNRVISVVSAQGAAI